MDQKTVAAKQVDPGILELVGTATELLGLAEHIQRFLPLDRLRMTRRHKRIENLLGGFRKALEDARAALRIIQSSIADGRLELPADAIGFLMPMAELPVFKRGIDQLHAAIRSMTNAALELEAATAGMSDEVQRYHRISASGRRILDKLVSTLHGAPMQLPSLLQDVEHYLTKCSEMISEATQWREL
jgi:hypothetical protein